MHLLDFLSYMLGNTVTCQLTWPGSGAPGDDGDGHQHGAGLLAPAVRGHHREHVGPRLPDVTTLSTSFNQKGWKLLSLSLTNQQLWFPNIWVQGLALVDFNIESIIWIHSTDLVHRGWVLVMMPCWSTENTASSSGPEMEYLQTSP